MNNLRQNFQHAQWGSIIGHEADIRLAVLKDELKNWEYTGIYQLRERVKELEKSALLPSNTNRIMSG